MNWEAKVLDFTLYAFGPLSTSEWKLWSVDRDFSPGNGMCPENAVDPLVWSSPQSCGAQYCDNAAGQGNYSRTFRLGPSGNGSLTLNGSTENGFDFVEVRNATGGLLFRESGVFSNRTINITNSPTVRVQLFSDYMVTDVGLSARLTRSDPQVMSVQSDPAWRATRAIGASDQNSWYLPEFEGVASWAPVQTRAGLKSSPWGATQNQTGPFDQSDANAAHWIWPAGVNQTNAPVEVVYMRRAFIAGKTSYTVDLRCDNSCTLYLDGEVVVNNSNFEISTRSTILTEVGRVHTFALVAANGGGAPNPAGVRLMAR